MYQDTFRHFYSRSHFTLTIRWGDDDTLSKLNVHRASDLDRINHLVVIIENGKDDKNRFQYDGGCWRCHSWMSYLFLRRRSYAGGEVFGISRPNREAAEKGRV